MKQTVEIQNLKCGGCANTIEKKLSSLAFINDLEIDVANSTLSFKPLLPEDTALVIGKLSELGYPILEENNSLGKKAKSYLSCAMGRIQK